MNVKAVFLHYLGDAISSLFVLVAGILFYFFDGKWTYYLDPVARYEFSFSVQYTICSLHTQFSSLSSLSSITVLSSSSSFSSQRFRWVRTRDTTPLTCEMLRVLCC